MNPDPDTVAPKMDETPTIHGLPVERADGARLAFYNTSSRTIHPMPTPSEQDEYDLRSRQSLCKMFGASGGAYTSAEPIYVTPDEFDAEFIVRDGDVQGKLCGNCTRKLPA